jgi:5-methylcytosine-specific restriction endonuclease McrA
MARRECEKCGRKNGTRINRHHIVPKRFGGEEIPENKSDLCDKCHAILHQYYERRAFELAQQVEKNFFDNCFIKFMRTEGYPR